MRRGTVLIAAASGLLLITPPAQALTPTAMVARTLVTSADIPTDYRVAPPGDGWADFPTVPDACKVKPTTERYRRVRQKVTVVTGQQTSIRPSASQEVVAYDTPARAALALKEWRAGEYRCKNATAVIFGTELVFRPTPIRTDPTLPVKDNAIGSLTMTSSSPQTLPHSYHYYVAQRHGRVLNIVRGSGPLSDKARIIRNTMRIARNTGKRQLAAR